MPRNPNYKQINLLLTPAQYAALEKAAGAMSVNEFLRRLLSQSLPDFPANDIPARGSYRRRG